MVEQSLFPDDGSGSTPTCSLQFNIRKISSTAAKPFIEQWHYSGRIPTGKNICYCLYLGQIPYAVIVYGIGVNPYQAKFLGVDKVLEIKRMCRTEPRLEYQLSQFIAITRKIVKKEYEYDAIVAFADPEHNHEGTVYKASGFTHKGMTNAEIHLIGDDGEKRHRRYAYRHARRNNISIADARRELNMGRIKTQPKHRWVYYG